MLPSWHIGCVTLVLKMLVAPCITSGAAFFRKPLNSVIFNRIGDKYIPIGPFSVAAEICLYSVFCIHADVLPEIPDVKGLKINKGQRSI
jgi:hypothetical protein